MSVYKAVQSEFVNQQRIVEALEIVCPEWAGKIEIAEQGSNSLIVHGTNEANVDIAVRKTDMKGLKANHGYGDLGLQWDETTGKYKWQISEDDQGKYEKRKNPQTGEMEWDPNGHYNSQYSLYGDDFIKEVNCVYAALELIEQAKAKGCRVSSDTPQRITDEQYGDCWGVEGEVDEDQLAKMGVRVL